MLCTIKVCVGKWMFGAKKCENKEKKRRKGKKHNLQKRKKKEREKRFENYFQDCVSFF